MRRLTVVLLVGLLVFAGCGGSKSSSSSGGSGPAQTSTAGGNTHLAKTKFLLHAGLAFGAFHRYILKPYRAGKLGPPLLKNKLAKVKAALAAGFAYHEVRLALNAARGSKFLSKVLSPLLALQTKLSSMRTGLRHGDTSQVTSANSSVDSANSASSAAGQPVHDQPTPSLGG